MQFPNILNNAKTGGKKKKGRRKPEEENNEVKVTTNVIEKMRKIYGSEIFQAVPFYSFC
jgi:hypothetical protein